MEAYNVRIYYYEIGTQYRIYSRPILKLTEEEKELKRVKDKESFMFALEQKKKQKHIPLEYQSIYR